MEKSVHYTDSEGQQYGQTSVTQQPLNQLPCIGEVYSSQLNKRLFKYLDENNLLAYEQNCLRNDRKKDFKTVI